MPNARSTWATAPKTCRVCPPGPVRRLVRLLDLHEALNLVPEAGQAAAAMPCPRRPAPSHIATDGPSLTTATHAPKVAVITSDPSASKKPALAGANHEESGPAVANP